MKMAKSVIFKSIIIFIFCLIAFLNDSYAEDSQYPIKVEIIEKDHARYDTPENAFAAMCSSSIKENLEWYYETLTEEAALQDKKAFEQAGIDPRKESEIFRKQYKQAYIINKHEYKHGVVLMVNVYSINGAVFTLPYTYVEEYGKWKLTNKFAGDDELMQYYDYTPPPILTANVKIQPKRWNIDLYNWINENLATSRLAQLLAEKMTVLTIIKDIKDKEGNSYNTNDIIFDSIRLNGIVPPQTWKVMGLEKTAIVQDSELNEKLKMIKGFDEWNRNESFIKNTRMPFILVRFNMFKSMGTLTEMKPHKKYDIEITGKLNIKNNENEKVFKGIAKIKLMGIRKSDTKGLKDSILPEAEHALQNWWNQETGLDDRWKSLRHDKPE